MRPSGKGQGHSSKKVCPCVRFRLKLSNGLTWNVHCWQPRKCSEYPHQIHTRSPGHGKKSTSENAICGWSDFEWEANLVYNCKQWQFYYH